MQSIGARSMQGSKMYLVPSLRDSALETLEFNVPFCLGKTHHYFKDVIYSTVSMLLSKSSLAV